MYPNSSLLTNIFVPDYFEPKTVSTEDGTLKFNKDYTFEKDITDTLSIIKLNKVPFIDLSKYDFYRRMWYNVDQFGGLWRKYIPGDYVIEKDYVFSSKWLFAEPRYYSQEGIDDDYYYLEPNALNKRGLLVSEYYPISIKLNNLKLTDVSNYTGIDNIIPKLDYVNPDQNKEFYFNKDTTIYTNQDLNVYEIDNISLSYTINIDTVNIKCRMNTNVIGFDNYTPTVDYYIVSLTGQNL